MQPKYRNILTQVLGVAAFLSVPFLLSPDFLSGQSMWHVPGFQYEMGLCVLLLSFFFLHYYFLVPKLYIPKHWALYAAAILISFLILLAFTFIVIPHGIPQGAEFPRIPGGPRFPHPPRLPAIFFRSRLWLFIAMVFAMVLFLSLHLRLNLRFKRLEQDRTDAEVAYLKAQINPHFLFNTLNSIYAMAIDKSDATADAIVKLSGMMRYVLNESGQEYVSLQKEMDYLSDYIDLQRTRLGDTVALQFAVSGDTLGKRIAPLLLISFIENAFKHGLNPEADASIAIDIQIKSDKLEMLVTNRKVLKATLETTDGIGIGNAVQRLKLQYPGRHTLKIEENQHDYRVWLSIQI
jgi:Histidine kinase